MKQLLKQFQGSIFEMYLAGRLTEGEFDILSALSEGMETDWEAVEVVKKITLEDLKDKDILDCVLARQFKTANLILG